MRTYTVRDVVGEGANTRLVVDIVVHWGRDRARQRLGPRGRARRSAGDDGAAAWARVRRHRVAARAPADGC